MKLKTSMAIAVSAVAMAAQVQAIQINGTIDFSSIAGKEVKLLGANSFLTATGLDFPAGPNAQIDGSTGNFPAVGTTATFKDFFFAPGADPVWVITGGAFSFTLDAGATVTRGAHFLTVDGVGTVHGVGFENTAGTFTLTTQGSPSKRRTSFSWSATDDAVPTPDGGATAILLGAGLLGLGAFASRKSVA